MATWLLVDCDCDFDRDCNCNCNWCVLTKIFAKAIKITVRAGTVPYGTRYCTACFVGTLRISVRFSILHTTEILVSRVLHLLVLTKHSHSIVDHILIDSISIVPKQDQFKSIHELLSSLSVQQTSQSAPLHITTYKSKQHNV